MQGDNHTDVVARVKAGLVDRGVDLTEPCGAFAITKRVAWELRAEGAGLLYKPLGNNCFGFSVDGIVYRDGTFVDCLIAAGNENGPAWQMNAPDTALIERWREPFDPGDVPAPPPPPTAPPELVDVMSRLFDIEVLCEQLRLQSDANTEKIQQQIDQVVKNAEASAAKLLPLLEGGLPSITDLFRKT